MTVLYSIIIAITSIARLAQTPIQLGIIILITALSVSLLFAWIISPWISFLIFLIYIGGILVIFSYFIAITPNQKLPLLSVIVTLLIFSLTTIFILNKLSRNGIQINNRIQTNTFYNINQTPSLIIIALILLITIIIVVKVSNSLQGPLRPFNYV